MKLIECRVLKTSLKKNSMLFFLIIILFACQPETIQLSSTPETVPPSNGSQPSSLPQSRIIRDNEPLPPSKIQIDKTSDSASGKQPIIESISSPLAIPGDTLIIKGKNFNNQPSANQVFFGNVPARVIKGTTSTLEVEVPDHANGHISLNNRDFISNIVKFTLLIPIQIDSPSQNNELNGQEIISTNVLSSIEIDKIEFYIDSVLLGVDEKVPYEWRLNTKDYSDGSYQLKARLISKSGKTFESRSIGVTIDNNDNNSSNPTPTPTPTTVSVANPQVPAITPTPVPTPICVGPTARPTIPTKILDETFNNLPVDFGSNQGAWQEFGGDYSDHPQGALLFNPHPAGDGTSNLESGIINTLPLNALTGDQLIAKFTPSPTFVSNNSKVEFKLEFNDTNSTVLQGDTLTGSGGTFQELIIQGDIPPCSTQVKVFLLATLGADETSSVIFEKVTIEQVPANYYAVTNLLNEPFDTSQDNAFGVNSPQNIEAEFGYDFYLVPNFPLQYSGDNAVTGNSGGLTITGGIVKRVDLPLSFDPQDLLTTSLTISTSFTSSNSNSTYQIEFFDNSDSRISTVVSSPVKTSHLKHIILDRVPIPANSTYVKLVPLVTFGTGETSSFLWNQMKLDLYHKQP